MRKGEGHAVIYWQVRSRSARSKAMSDTQSQLRRKLEPLLRRMFHLYWRIARGMTLGVRGVVLDSGNKVFLVKHSYVAGWHLPGGGVEVGETFMEALTRELAEEGRIVLVGHARIARPVLQQPRLPPGSRGGLRDQALQPGPHARAEPRDRRLRLLCGKRAARRHNRGDAAAHCRGARWRGADRDMALMTVDDGLAGSAANARS